MSERPTSPPLTEAEREQLSAYLDGELDERTAQDVSAALGQRPEVRQEADALKKTWDLLDYLPRPTAPRHFTARTLERLESTKGILLRQGQRWRQAALVGWALALLLAAAGGFAATSFLLRPVLVEPAPTITEILPAEDRDPPDVLATAPRPSVHMPWFLHGPQDRLNFMAVELQRIRTELEPKLSKSEDRDLKLSIRQGPLVYIDKLLTLAKQHGIALQRGPVDELTQKRPKPPPAKPRPTSPG